MIHNHGYFLVGMPTCRRENIPADSHIVAFCRSGQASTPALSPATPEAQMENLVVNQWSLIFQRYSKWRFPTMGVPIVRMIYDFFLP